MKTLLIDIGNTFIKIATTGQDKIIQQWPLIETNDKAVEAKLKQAFSKNSEKKIKITIISCVVPNLVILIKNLVSTTYSSSELLLLDLNLVKNFPLTIKLANRDLGSDLIALTYGAYKYHDVIVVSLGTATTYNIILNKQLVGVIIAPGFTASKNSLILGAALLSDFEFNHYNSLLGKSTNHALSVGYGYGFNAMINGTVTKIKKEVKKKNMRVILTGGAVPTLAPYFDFCYDYEPQILFFGLVNIVQYWRKNY